MSLTNDIASKVRHLVTLPDNSPKLTSEGSPLDVAKASQSTALNARCQMELQRGFQSKALGSLHTYPAQLTDQINLNRSVNAALIVIASGKWVSSASHAEGDTIWEAEQGFICVAPGTSSRNLQDWGIPVGLVTTDGTCKWQIWTTPLWCEPEGGKWVCVQHTAKQVQQLGKDSHHAMSKILTKSMEFQTRVKAATSIEEVQAVVWTD